MPAAISNPDGSLALLTSCNEAPSLATQSGAAPLHSAVPQYAGGALPGHHYQPQGRLMLVPDIRPAHLVSSAPSAPQITMCPNCRRQLVPPPGYPVYACVCGARLAAHAPQPYPQQLQQPYHQQQSQPHVRTYASSAPTNVTVAVRGSVPPSQPQTQMQGAPGNGSSQSHDRSGQQQPPQQYAPAPQPPTRSSSTEGGPAASAGAGAFDGTGGGNVHLTNNTNGPPHPQHQPYSQNGRAIPPPPGMNTANAGVGAHQQASTLAVRCPRCACILSAPVGAPHVACGACGTQFAVASSPPVAPHHPAGAHPQHQQQQQPPQPQQQQHPSPHGPPVYVIPGGAHHPGYPSVATVPVTQANGIGIVPAAGAPGAPVVHVSQQPRQQRSGWDSFWSGW